MSSNVMLDGLENCTSLHSLRFALIFDYRDSFPDTVNKKYSMPKLYEYFGLIILFYSNEHEPVHVHGKYQDRESKAEIIIENGKIVEIRITSVKGKKPLEQAQFKDFGLVVEHYAKEIVQKWIDYFVYHKSIQAEKITRRIK